MSKWKLAAEIVRLRAALRYQARRYHALHLRVGVAEGWIIDDEATRAEIREVFALYDGPYRDRG